MNIGFDIDGVLTDVEKFQLERGKDFFKKNFNMDIINPLGYSIQEIFNCTKQQEYMFWKENIIDYSKNYKARPGVGEMIKKIISDGNKCFIISSRIKASDNDFIGFYMRYLVKKFLNNEGIPYDKIVFCSTNNSAEDKLTACINNNIHIIVEDSPENILLLSKKMKVICYNCSYNKLIENNNVIRVNNFYEIYEYINRENSKSKFKYLKRDEREKLNNEQLSNYYKQLKEYYINSTDNKKIAKQEKTYKVLYPIMKKIFDLKYPYEIENEENIPTENGVIYVANHRDMIDPPIVMSVIGNKPTHLLLKSEFLDTKAGNFLKSIGCVFVNRSNKDSQILSKEELIKIVLNKGNIVMFPEGTRNKTNETLLEFKLGAVAIAQITGAPIVPISITKKFDDYNEKINVKIGEKMYINYYDDILKKNQELKDTIETMIIDNTSKKLIKK